ncbi:MAG TPA: glycosyltransferase family 2 protein [Blastocatellia bacterium]|jgi:glycosyltransferase involved in cell wall biosynthesis
MKLPSVSVCFPAYNEEATVGEVLQEAHDLLSASKLDYEIIVCNDGSADRTATIIEDIAARLPRIRALNNPRNLGIRATFERLYSEAAKEFVFLNSTDQQWPTRILFDMLRLSSDWDIIIASRKEKHYNPARRFVSWGFNLAPSIVFGVRTYDAGAVKLVRREIIERFTLVSQSPFSEAERLIRAARAGYRITQYPVEIAARHAGRARGVSFSSVIEALKDVVRLRLDLRNQKSDEPGGDRPKELRIR